MARYRTPLPLFGAPQPQSTQSSSAASNGPPSSSGNSASTSLDAAGAAVASASTALDRVMGLMDGFEDDLECPLCLEEMDVSDLNFKPCPCGYQICRFCWNHIKENLNNRCPACRKPYDEAEVEFKPVKPDELKRLREAKKVRDKRRKESESMLHSSKANVRVRQRCQVHIQGMTTKTANEDTVNLLKSPQHFGQYGKIMKLFLAKRTPQSTLTQTNAHSVFQPVSVYINYRSPNEAAACIAAVDGSSSYDGRKLRASFGTTRYCGTYLRGAKCMNEECMLAHEPGEEIDGNTGGHASREEMLNYSLIGDMGKNPGGQPQRSGRAPEPSLPPSASWGSKPSVAAAPAKPAPRPAAPPGLVAAPAPVPVPVPALAPAPAPATPKTHPLPARPSSTQRSKVSTSQGRTQSPDARGSKQDQGAGEEPPMATPARGRIDSKASYSPAPVAANGMSASSSSDGESASHDGISRPPSVPPFPELDFGDPFFQFSLSLDDKGKGKEPWGTGADAGIAAPQVRDLSNLDDLRRIASPIAAGLTDMPSSLGTGSSFAPAPAAPSYAGSFDPFAEAGGLDAFGGGVHGDPHSASSTPPLHMANGSAAEEDSRRGSRFGFARRGSSNVSALNGIRPSFSGSFHDLGMNGGSAFSSPLSTNVAQLDPAPPASSATPFGSVGSAATNGVGSFGAAGTAANMPLPQHRATPPGLMRQTSSMSGNLPPGLSAPSSRPPMAAAAAFTPLPPPAPRPNGQQPSNAKIDSSELLALIAKAQAQQAQAQHQHQHQHQHQQTQAPQHPHSGEATFADPAIFSARLARSPLPPPQGAHALLNGFGGSQMPNSQPPASMPPAGAFGSPYAAFGHPPPFAL